MIKPKPKEGGCIYTIYLDILYCINLFVTYLLLLSTKALAQSSPNHTRVVLASLLGAGSSLFIFLPAMSIFLLSCIKVAVSVVLVFVAFGRRRLAKHLLLFYLVNFLYAGLMTAVAQWLPTDEVLYQNGVLYFPLSAMRLCLLTVVAYGVIQLFSALLFRTTAKDRLATMKIGWDGQTVLVTTLLDTGSLVRDVVTGLPVVICQTDQLEGLFDEDVLCLLEQLQLDQLPVSLQKIFHLVPIHGIGESKLLVAFQPSTLSIWHRQGWIACDGVVALANHSLSQEEFEAIAPAKLIN